LAEYQIAYLHYGVSVVEALVLAKVILIGEALRLGRGLEDKPLIVPTPVQSGRVFTAVQIERGAARTARDFLGFWTDAALDRDQVARGCCPD